jgi:hypothetical protein
LPCADAGDADGIAGGLLPDALLIRFHAHGGEL